MHMTDGHLTRVVCTPVKDANISSPGAVSQIFSILLAYAVDDGDTWAGAGYDLAQRTMRFESITKVLAKCMLMYYRISECIADLLLNNSHGRSLIFIQTAMSQVCFSHNKTLAAFQTCQNVILTFHRDVHHDADNTFHPDWTCTVIPSVPEK